jgi:hypothetical protein
VGENDGSVLVTVNMASASSTPVTVDYTTVVGTATPVLDYATTSGTLLFAPGVTSVSFTVLVNSDAIDEVDETFSVTTRPSRSRCPTRSGRRRSGPARTGRSPSWTPTRP